MGIGSLFAILTNWYTLYSADSGLHPRTKVPVRLITVLLLRVFAPWGLQIVYRVQFELTHSHKKNRLPRKPVLLLYARRNGLEEVFLLMVDVSVDKQHAQLTVGAGCPN